MSEAKSRYLKSNKKGKIGTKVEISAGGIVFKKIPEGYQFLLIKDSYGRWALPKGHLEHKENIFKAALREIYEETGLKNLKIIKKLNSANYFFKLKGKLIFKIVYYFLVEVSSDSKLKIDPKEVQDAQWFRPEAAVDKIAYKDLKPIFKKACKYLARNNEPGKEK